MILIIAVLASVIGFVSGVVSVFVLGMSLVTGIAIYFGVAFAMIGTFTLSILARGGVQVAVGSQMDEARSDAWQEYTAPMTEEEAAFQEAMDVPLTEGERLRGVDKDTA